MFASTALFDAIMKIDAKVGRGLGGLLPAAAVVGCCFLRSYIASLACLSPHMSLSHTHR